MPAVWGSSVRTPAKPRASSCPASATRRFASSQAILPAEASVANPVDMLGSASDDSYRTALPLLLADAAIDAVIALFVPAVSATAEAVANAIAEARAAAGADTPLLAVVMSAEGIPAPLRAEANVSAFTYPESAARALGRAAERADWLRRPLGTVPDVGDIDHDARCGGRGEGARRRRGQVARTRRGAEASARLRHPPRPRAACVVGGRGSGRRPLARVSGGRQDCGPRGTQDGDGRYRARSDRAKRRFGPPSTGSERPSSCSP